MRRIIENPRDIPALRSVIEAADELGCTVGAGYTMGDTVTGLSLTNEHGQAFLVEVNPHNFRKGSELVRKAVQRHNTLG